VRSGWRRGWEWGRSSCRRGRDTGYSFAKKSVERIEAFRADAYGRNVGGEIDLEELIARLGFMSRREA
jgi:hypothetical protein